MSYRAEKQSTNDKKSKRGVLAESAAASVDSFMRGYQAAIDELYKVGKDGGGRAAWASIQRRATK